MTFGMTARLPWPKSDPRHVWQVWDDFGIADAQMLGWWDTNCPVRTGRDDILATAYVKPGKTLLALASWATNKTEVHLQFDWPALGLNPAKARRRAPEIKDYQPACEWLPDQPIPSNPPRLAHLPHRGPTQLSQPDPHPSIPPSLDRSLANRQSEIGNVSPFAVGLGPPAPPAPINISRFSVCTCCRRC